MAVTQINNKVKGTVTIKIDDVKLSTYAVLRSFCLAHRITYTQMLDLMVKLVPILHKLAVQNQILLVPRGTVEE